MENTRKTSRDPFAFSLRGMSTMASFMAPVVIADDRLRRRPRRETPAAGAPDARRDWQPAEQAGC